MSLVEAGASAKGLQVKHRSRELFLCRPNWRFSQLHISCLSGPSGIFESQSRRRLGYHVLTGFTFPSLTFSRNPRHARDCLKTVKDNCELLLRLLPPAHLASENDFRSLSFRAAVTFCPHQKSCNWHKWSGKTSLNSKFGGRIVHILWNFCICQGTKNSDV